MRVSIRLSLILSTLLGLSCQRARPSDPALVSATQFVKAFYTWYLPSAQKGSGLELATGDSAVLFAPLLVSALRADAEAQAKSSQEIVGLDSDPFLDAQDFCEAYEVGTARHETAGVSVEVHGSCSGQRDSLPDVVAELTRGSTGWVFVNFRYPRRNSDLMKDLDELRRARDARP